MAHPCGKAVRDVVGHRPLTVAMSWVTPDGTAEAQAWESQPGDVFIVTYPKTGTCLLLQLCCCSLLPRYTPLRDDVPTIEDIECCDHSL
jgi:hypothetical protein